MIGKHILLIPSGYPTVHSPASGVFYKNQAQALRKAGLRVGVIYPDVRSLKTFSRSSLKENNFQVKITNENNIPTIYFHGWNFPNARLRRIIFIRSCLFLARLYIQNYGRPDLIHAHSILWAGVAGMLIAKKYNIPYIITEHSSAFARELINEWQKPYIRQAINHCACMIAVSESLAKQIVMYSQNKDIYILPNLLNVEFFKPPVNPRSGEPIIFLTIALLTQNKRIDLLIHAFARSFKNVDNVFLWIGGDGPQRKKLERLASELGIINKISFLGLLNQTQVRDAMWRASIFVLPSNIETFGVVLIEAIATGLPVIATKSGGPNGFINEKVGVLIEPENVDILSKALKRMIIDWRTYDTNDLFNYIKQNFSEKVIVQKLLGIYNTSKNSEY